MPYTRQNWFPFFHVFKRCVRTTFTRNVTNVRVRFAPSPTGLMHIGGLRTALVNKLFAVQQNGVLVLRIEDTDKTRCYSGAIDDINCSLHWAGLEPDEGPTVGGIHGPYIQSERRSLYTTVAEKLIKDGSAYRCFCSIHRLELLRSEQSRRGEAPHYDNRCRTLTNTSIEKMLQAGQPFIVRFKVPTEKITVHDAVFGDVTFESQDSEGDFVILKSDGMPVYHLANVVDDHYMGISHVIRGVEWLSSTPKHLLLYAALDWTPPQFVHLPLLLSSSGGKLSKRSPEFAQFGQVKCLITAGYLPSAVLTWLFSVGTGLAHIHNDASNWAPDRSFDQWSPLLRFDDLVTRFSFSRIRRQNVKISPDLLRICGRVHFDKMAADALTDCSLRDGTASYKTPELLTRTRAFLNENLPDLSIDLRSRLADDKWLAKKLCSLQGRVACLSDLVDNKQGSSFVWLPVDPKACADLVHKVAEKSSVGLMHIVAFLKQMTDILSEDGTETLDARIKKTCHATGIGTALGMRLIRVCLTGLEAGPPVVEVINLLALTESHRRLCKLMDELIQAQSNKFHTY